MVVRECKNWQLGKRLPYCVQSINPERPHQTQYCDGCRTYRKRDWGRENYGTERSREQRERWAETHGGKTYNESIAEKRAAQRERTSDELDGHWPLQWRSNAQ